MNDVIKTAFQKASLPSVLEPPGLGRGDESRPDGMTVLPFIEGKSLVWDCACLYFCWDTPEQVSDGSWHSCKQRRGAQAP